MSLIVEPAQVRKPHRGPDPAPLALIGIVAFVALAIAKPWQPAPTPAPNATPTHAPSSPQVAAASPSASGPANATPTPTTVGGAADAGPLLWSNLLEALTPQDGYGLRVVTRAGGVRPGTLPVGATASESNVTASIDGAYHVTWLAANGVGDPILVTNPDPGQPILALGVTARAGRAPLDIRFWRLVRGRAPQRLSPRPVLGDPALGDRLFLPPSEDGAVAGWLPASYYVDLLEGALIERFAFELWTGDAARDPPRRFNPPPPTEAVAPLDELVIGNRVAGLPRAPFTIDPSGHGHGWVADSGAPLEAAGAWLATAKIPVAPAVPESSARGGQVARAFGPEPAAIGVILPRGAIVTSARLVSLAPDPGVASETPMVGPVGSAFATGLQGVARRKINLTQRSFVAFVPSESSTWPAGVYRIDLGYIGAAGIETKTSWHIDIAGTGADEKSVSLPQLLDAAARWSGVPSGWAIVTGGTPSRQSAPPAPGPIVVWSDPPLAPDPSASPDPAGPEVCDSAAVLATRRAVIAISVPAALTAVEFRVVRVFPGIGGVRVPAVVAPGVQAGMWLLAPPRGSGMVWASGRYQIEVIGDPTAPSFFEGLYRVCFGSFSSVSPVFSLAAGALSVEQFRAARLEPGAQTYRVLQPGTDPAILEQ